MPKLKVPSVQHLSRNWHPNSDVIKNKLVRLARKPPRFSYEQMFGAVVDLLLLRVPYEQIVEGINRGVRREAVKKNFLDLLPLVNRYFAGLAPDYYQSVARRYYPAGRGLLIPFDPPLIYGTEGTVHFPWFSFWRRNPLSGKRLSLFASLVDDILLQDPDLEGAKFAILDFSAPAANRPRELLVIDATRIPRLSKEVVSEMLAVFAKGFLGAKAELAATPRTSPETGRTTDDESDQPDLFDDEID